MPKAAKGEHYPKMMTHRTTNPLQSTRLTLRRLLLAPLLLGLFGSTMADAAGRVEDDIQVRLESGSNYAPQWPPDLILEGTWNSSCLPVVASTRLVDKLIDIQLKIGEGKCAEASTPFLLKLNPARAAGLRQLALGVYQVRLFLKRGNGGSDLIGFRLLRAGALDSRPRPESGFWWSIPTLEAVPALAGNGLSIEQQGENLAVTWLSYDGGRPVWYFGSTRMPGSIARVELLRMAGGGEPFSGPNSAPGAEPGLSMNLQFHSPSHASAWLVHDAPFSAQAIEVQNLNLSRLPFEDGHPGAHWQGQWALVIGAASEARILDLANLATADAESFQVSDRLGSVSLQCRLDNFGGHPLPAFCSLTDGASILADFDLVGLDRLSGSTADGESVRLVRLAK